MNTTITERDKKLLIRLGTLFVVLVYALVVMRPMVVADMDLRRQINENKTLIAEAQEKSSTYSLVQAQNESLHSQLNQDTDGLYPMLRSQEIDRILTDRVMVYNLTTQRMSIAMPDAPANVTLFGNSSGTGSNPDGLDGIWIAQVDIQVTGSQSGLEAFVDNLSTQMPGIMVRSVSWSSSNSRSSDTLNVQYDNASVQLGILMSRKE